MGSFLDFALPQDLNTYTREEFTALFVLFSLRTCSRLEQEVQLMDKETRLKEIGKSDKVISPISWKKNSSVICSRPVPWSCSHLEIQFKWKFCFSKSHPAFGVSIQTDTHDPSSLKLNKLFLMSMCLSLWHLSYTNTAFPTCPLPLSLLLPYRKLQCANSKYASPCLRLQYLLQQWLQSNIFSTSPLLTTPYTHMHSHIPHYHTSTLSVLSLLKYIQFSE